VFKTRSRGTCLNDCSGNWQQANSNTFTQFKNVPLNQNRDIFWLLAIALTTVALWQFPNGEFILYPFTILGTWFHEMGHGLTALLLGASFKHLQIFPNGSGIATHTSDVFFGRFGHALVAAGGPMGPPIAGAFFLRLSRNGRNAKYVLPCFSIALLLSVVFWVRSSFGIIAILFIGGFFLLVSLRRPGRLQKFMLQVLGVQACISTFKDFDYLLTPSGLINGQKFLSDTSVIADNLFLPYWFWAIVIAAFSLMLLVHSLKALSRTTTV